MASKCLFLLFGVSLLLCGAAQLKAGKWFDRIVILQVLADLFVENSHSKFENHSEKEVLADPNFSKYAAAGRAMLNYFAVTHPSQPNYWYY